MRWSLAFVTTVLAAGPVLAAPAKMSRHPRTGELGEISFPEQSARLSLDDNQKLGEIAGWATENPAGLIVLDGHSAPNEPDGVRLSMLRAEAVRDRLVSLGIDSDRVVVAAFGTRGATATRRVVAWGTREDADTVMSRLEDRGATAVERGGVSRPAG